MGFNWHRKRHVSWASGERKEVQREVETCRQLEMPQTVKQRERQRELDAETEGRNEVKIKRK